MSERMISLLDFLGNYDLEIKKVENSKNTYIVDNKQYIVLTDSEANNLHRQYIQKVIDNYILKNYDDISLKLDIEYIIDNYINSQYFDESIKQHYEMYTDEIECEKAFSDNFETRLEEEMAEENCKDKNSYINYLCSLENSIEWYRNIFGDIGLLETADVHGAIDIDGISDYYINEYGRGYNLSDYDGDELELINGYYAYRIS